MDIKKCMKFALISILFFCVDIYSVPKVLHLSFHRGCINDFKYVAKHLNFELTSIFIPDMPKRWLDGKSSGNNLYNIGHQRACDIWEKHKNYFEGFDAIITSDTAPLARIFLQNNWKKPLVIWVCNRFDYYDRGSLDCDFPDKEFYDLFRYAIQMKNVRIASYTPFEYVYARSKGVDIGTFVIKPCAIPLRELKASSIPPSIDKKETFFIPPYHNDTVFLNMVDKCRDMGIPVYGGRYNGPADIQDFKGIIHLPYAWSNLALFENIQNGIPYFVPSIRFLTELMKQKNYWFCSSEYLADFIRVAEWYCDDYKDIITYFDSWTDLAEKIRNTDFTLLKRKILDCALEHRSVMMSRWKEIFERFGLLSKGDKAPFALLKSLLPDNPIVLEAGAHIGQDTVLMSQLWSQGKIYAFEPNPVIYETLKQAVKTCNNVLIEQVALSEKVGEAAFFISGGDQGASSLLQPTDSVNRDYFHADVGHPLFVKTNTIDTWAKENCIPCIDFMWLDMEGNELHALKSATEVLKNVKVIYTEVNLFRFWNGCVLYNELCPWLEALGFEKVWEDIVPHWHGNVVFVNKRFFNKY